MLILVGLSFHNLEFHAALKEMQYSGLFLIKGTLWTTGAYAFGTLLRVVTSVALARLLAPELFGIMVIANAVKTGVDLISDVGIGQNIVHNPNAEKPEFYNTAWTLRIIRAVLLWLVIAGAAALVARFYQMPILTIVLPLIGLTFVIGAFGSIAPHVLQKRMSFARLNAYEVVMALFSSAVYVLFAYFIPTIWSLVLGALVASAMQSASSYFLLPMRHRFYVAKEYVQQIFSFGRWIFVASIIYFLSMNFDRLYYGKVAALGMVGVYGIARSQSDLVNILIVRLSNYLVFPLIAASQSMPRSQLRAALAMKRLVVMLVSAVGVAVLVTTADIIIKIMYDQRYQAAGWMLPVLFLGTWFSLIASLNESTLLGLGKPVYSAVAYGFKFASLLVGLPIGFAKFGLLGVVVVVATSDLWRYVPILIGQIRARFSYAGQDFVATLALFGFLGLFELLRWSIGFGTSFDGLPIASTG